MIQLCVILDLRGRLHVTETGPEQALLKHSIRVCRFFGYILNYVPMLDNFPVHDTENVDNRTASVFCIGFGIVVNCNQIPISDHSYYFGPDFRIFLQIGSEKINGSLCARGCKRIMLLVIWNAVELEGFLDFVFVENHS